MKKYAHVDDDDEVDDEAAAFDVLDSEAASHRKHTGGPGPDMPEAEQQQGGQQQQQHSLTSFDELDEELERVPLAADRKPWLCKGVQHRVVVAVLTAVLLVIVVVASWAAMANNVALAQRLGELTAGTPSPTPATQQQQPIVVLVSIDGFRADYLARGLTPNLSRMAAGGARAPAMQPVFPSATFPNHYALVTGLYAETHGIVANTFYDPVFNATFRYTLPADATDARWWAGEPIWNTVVKAGKRAYCAFWPGSEAAVQGIHPSVYLSYVPLAAELSNTKRMQLVLEWLGEDVATRPSLVTAYMSSVDSAGHSYGTEGPQIDLAIQQADAAIGVLLDGIAALSVPINVVVVSDHGMTDLSPQRVVFLGKAQAASLLPANK